MCIEELKAIVKDEDTSMTHHHVILRYAAQPACLFVHIRLLTSLLCYNAATILAIPWPKERNVVGVGKKKKNQEKVTNISISTPLLRQSASCIHRKIHTKFCGLDVNAVYTMSQQAKGYIYRSIK